MLQFLWNFTTHVLKITKGKIENKIIVLNYVLINSYILYKKYSQIHKSLECITNKVSKYLKFLTCRICSCFKIERWFFFSYIKLKANGVPLF